MGQDCGYHYAADYHDCYGTAHVEYRKGCEKCCANAEACWPYDHVLGYWYHQWGPGYDDEWTEYPDTCQPWPVPTWEDCTNPCGHAKCHMMSRKRGFSLYRGVEPTSCKRSWFRDTVCDGYGDDSEAAPGCGYHRTERGCYEWDWQSQGWVESPNKGYGCTRRVEGYSYFACTPDECNAGWDDDHGGQFTLDTPRRAARDRSRSERRALPGAARQGFRRTAWTMSGTRACTSRPPARRATSSAVTAWATCSAAAKSTRWGRTAGCGSTR